MSNTILYRAPFGIAGNLSRGAAHAIIEPAAFNPSLPFPGYGLPGKIVNNFFVPIAALADVVYAFLARPFPTQGANASDPLGASVPPTSGNADAMVFGYIDVVCNAGVPAQGGQVYVRGANAAGGTPIGGIEAALVASTTVAIPGAIFMGPADANGNVSVRFNV
jgi:hypothetical protein